MSESLSLSLMGTPLSTHTLGPYIGWVNSIPLLSAEEELVYSKQLHEEGNLDAARKLILPHLRLVVKIARSYNGYGLQQADLIQEGNIGLMKAVKRFDPQVGVRLVTYAMHWIRAEIQDFVLKNWRIVKVATTKAQRKCFFKLRKLAERFSLSQSEASIIADELKVSEKDVFQMHQRLYANDMSLTHCMDDSDEGVAADFATNRYLEDHSSDHAQAYEQANWDQQQYHGLTEALMSLNAREQDIIQQRWLVGDDKKATLHELAEKYQVSAERIRQIEKNALEKMQGLLVH